MKKISFMLFCWILLGPSIAQALVAGSDVIGLDFRYNNPGARANAMGGAFIGLADDASASYSNPAGLTVLTKPELSVEYKSGKYTTRLHDWTGTHDHENSLSDLSFISYAFPKEKSTITVFKHKLAHAVSDYHWSDEGSPSYPPGMYSFSENHIDLDGDTLGLGFGLKLLESLSAGLTMSFSQIDYLASQRTHLNTDPDTSIYLGEINDSDKAEHFTVALLWDVFSELRLGLVYHEGAKFDFTRSSKVEVAPNTGIYDVHETLNHTLYIPEVFGVGVSYNFPIGLTIAADANHIKYSDLLTDVLDINGNPADYFSTEDVWELHFGLEYVMEASSLPVALRAGYFYRPSYAIRNSDPTQIQPVNQDLAGDDDNIYTVGIGVVLTDNLQVDISSSFGDLVAESYCSFVYRLE